MKKITFLLLTVAAWMGVQAQNVTYLHNGVAYGENDTIECTLSHGVMLELDGFGVTNNGDREAHLIYMATYVEGNENITVGGICIAGGQCTSGNTSTDFYVSGNSTYDDIALEMMVPDEVDNGDYALFRLNVVDADMLRKDAVPYTWLRVRCNTSGIQSVQTLPLQVYPNPATDRFVVETGNLMQDATLQVYNAQGQLVLTQPVQGASCTVNAAQWAAGVYQCQLISNGRVAATATVVK